MFTGIIEEVGTVAELRTTPSGGQLRIQCAKVLPKVGVASSVAVSGCCLTVVEKDERSFACDLAPETLNRTGFRRLQAGAKVNLEACLTPSTPLDGHIVQGHVDGTGTLLGLPPAGDDSSTGSEQENWWLDVEVPEKVTPYLAEKGSVAVEGISLTVAAIEETRLRIAIIPYTYQHTNLRTLKPGDPVNLECDVLAKYVEKLLQERPPATAARSQARNSGLTLERLLEEGF